MKITKNKLSLSSQRKAKKSQFWREQSLEDSELSASCIEYIKRKNIEIHPLESTRGASSFSAIVDSLGSIIIK